MRNRPDLIGQLVSAALAILVAAIALRVAVALVLEVWPALVAGAAGVLVLFAIIARLRRSDRW